jgi:flavin reductase (DIM6/NTAB) family NADH-FMN oxidoreductase RutF
MDDKTKGIALNQIGYGLYVIGSRAGDEYNGMTANWVTQISFDPTLVAIAIQNDSKTRELIEKGKAFSINIIAAGDKALLTRFIKHQRRVGNKLGEDDIEVGVTGAPILKAALSFVECRIVSQQTPGDHTLFIGEVVNAGVHRESNPIHLDDTGWSYGG